jgi:hypothetical protein
MKVTINHLLSLARLPVHFWTELRGGKEHYGNPGTSLMSYAVHKLSNEIINIPLELYESVNECTAFIKDPESLSAIYVWINTNATEVATQATNLSDKAKPKVYNELQALMSSLDNMKSMYETVAGSRGAIGDTFDPDQQVCKLYMQALIDAKNAILDLRYALEQLASVPKGSA